MKFHSATSQIRSEFNGHSLEPEYAENVQVCQYAPCSKSVQITIPQIQMSAILDKSNSQDRLGNYFDLSVKNFGPIRKANVQIRPLTVFLGKSNTGKSYIATLIYSLHRYFSKNLGESSHIYPFGIRSLRVTEEIASDPDIVKGFDSWVSVLSEEGNIPSFPKPIEKVIRSIIEDTKDMVAPIEQEIIRCYGIKTIQELIRHPSAKKSEIVIDLHLPDEECNLQYHLAMSHNKLDVTSKIKGTDLPFPNSVKSRELIMLSKRILSDLNRDSVPDSHNIMWLLEMFSGMTRSTLYSLLRRNAYYLPADRTGVMHSHQVVVSALIQNASTAGLRPAHGVPILSGVLSDFLEQLIQMASKPPSEINEKFDSLASRVEDAVLRGGINIDASSVNYPHFFYKPKNWKLKLPLMRSSSMVSELAPIVLYLRHILKTGDILIIEEPESHLHPEMQVEVIRHLVEVVRSGIQVVVTTHSEWVLDELATIVQRSQKNEYQQGIAGNASGYLYPHEVGAWLFKNHGNSDGVIVEELEIDNSGLYPSGFDQVAVDQHNRWAEVVSA